MMTKFYEMQMAVTRDPREATFVTHPAPHHGDDVMAAVMAMIVDGSVNVMRTRKPDEITAATVETATKGVVWVCDVGGEYNPVNHCYDHHQAGYAEAREDGTKYSSAGLLWREFGARICAELTGCTEAQAESAAKTVDNMLIRGIDLADYGEKGSDSQMSVSQAISLLNPNWDECADDEIFIEASQMAYTILVRTVESCVAAEVGKDKVDEAIETSEDKILVLPQFVTGWLERAVTSTNPKAEKLLYGVFKNLQGQWNVQALPPTLAERSAQRKPLPEAWRGQNGTALQEVTGVEDAVFCHAGGFICGAKSREGALALAKAAVGTTVRPCDERAAEEEDAGIVILH